MNAKPATVPAPHPFTLRLALGLVGVLIAALTSGLNDRVSDIALADIRAAIGISTIRVAGLFPPIRRQK